MEGIHLLGEWYGCPADEPLLTQASALRDMCRRAVDESGLTIVGDSFFQFEPQGVTGTVLLAESHLAIHTWPEIGFVSIDVYVCNLCADNSARAHQLYASLRAALAPADVREHVLNRGSGPGQRREHMPNRDSDPEPRVRAVA